MKIMKFNKLSLRSLYSRLVRMGVDITEEEFERLSPMQLKTIYNKAKKAYLLYCEIDKIVRKEEIPEVEFTEEWEDLE
jgi:hypothetical protein